MEREHTIQTKTPGAVAERLFAVTTFKTNKTTQGGRVDKTWPALCAIFEAEKTLPNKDALPLMKIGTFRGDSRAAGSAVLSVDALCADYDAGVRQMAEAARLLEVAGVRAFLYTTASHKPEAPHWRAVVPLSASITEEQHQRLMDLLNGALGGILAPESWNWARCYYYRRVEGVVYETLSVNGDLLDIVARAPDFEPMPSAKPVKKARAAKGGDVSRGPAETASPLLTWMRAGGWPIHEERDNGLVDVPCPWAHEHSLGGAEFASIIPAGVGGEDADGFKCLHAHCESRTIFDFTRKTGFDVHRLASEFDGSGIEVTAEEHAAACARAAIFNARYEERGHPLTASAAVTLEDFYAYAPKHEYIHRPTRAHWPASSVNGMVTPWPKGAGDKAIAPSKWLDANSAVQQMTWMPGEPELIKDRIALPSGFAVKPGARVFNRYVPPAPFTGDAEMAGPWLDHLKLVYPDDWGHLLLWFAHRVQRPGEKVNHALVLGGAQGIGKDTILEPVKHGVGVCNVQDVAPGALFGQFNEFAASVMLVVSEARDLGGGTHADRFRLYDHCKTLITAPPDVTRVNEKFIGAFYVPNLVGVIFTTNYRSGLYLQADDRRHYVAFSEAKKGHLSADYFKTLYDWYAAGGIGHVLAYLHALDLSAFNPKGEPRKTDAFWAMVHAGEEPESNELQDAIKACGSPAALSVRMVRAAAANIEMFDLAAMLIDPKARARLPHMFERVGYVVLRNPGAKDGRFGKETIYAQAGLDRSVQLAAACKISQAGPRESRDGAYASEFA